MTCIIFYSVSSFHFDQLILDTGVDECCLIIHNITEVDDYDHLFCLYSIVMKSIKIVHLRNNCV